MQNVWRSCKSRENGAPRREAAGGHLLARGKNRNEAERRRSKAASHRGQKFWKNLLGRSFFLSWNQNPDDAAPRTRLAPRGGHYGGRDWHQRTAASVGYLRQDVIADCLVALLLGASALVWGCRAPANPQAGHVQIGLNLQEGDFYTAFSFPRRALQQYRPESELVLRVPT